jgi:class 3 adenylate cyclase/predicted ATPase
LRHKRVHCIPRSTFVTIATRPPVRRDGGDISHRSEKQKQNLSSNQKFPQAFAMLGHSNTCTTEFCGFALRPGMEPRPETAGCFARRGKTALLTAGGRSMSLYSRRRANDFGIGTKVQESSTAEKLRVWLETHELATLHGRFIANDVDLEILPELTDADLKELGLSLGQRRRLMKGLREVSPPETRTGVIGSASSSSSNRAERRQLTVMFVDLVGSTAMSTRLDPEDMGEVIRLYQNTVAGEIARLDGHLAKFMGDGILAYFGWPTAHEDEAERAIRVGLSIVSSVARLQNAQQQQLAARIGIATGLVVVGDLIGEGAAQEEAVVGDTPNLAARLQERAGPGEVVVSEQTHRLAQDAFSFRDLGDHALKGIDKPVRIFTVTGERTGHSRFDVRSGGRDGSLFGREQELASLREQWFRAAKGEAKAVLLLGEAGIGKSRLVEALIDAIEEPCFQIRYLCSPYYRDSPLFPVVQQLRHAAQISAEDCDDLKLDKIEGLLDVAGRTPEAAPLVADLLGIPAHDRYPRSEISPQLQRIQTLSVLVDQLLGLAAQKPVLVLVEDVHWVDPTTLEMLQLALDKSGRSRIMTVFMSRPDGAPALAAHPLVTRLMLNRLSQDAVGAIASRIAGTRRLPQSVLDEIASRADGVPLFVEELTKAVVELTGEGQSGERIGTAAIPATLHDSLMARLDRVPAAKRVAQVAACVGREFHYRILSSIAGLSPADLDAALDRLASVELLFCRGAPPEATYTFKHALVRDAAANSLLLSERRRIHAGIADALATSSPPGPPELIAQHAEAAGLGETAIQHWLRAGHDAAVRYANVEAISYFERALKLVLSKAEGEARDRQELGVLIALGVPQIAARGYASDTVERTCSRARTLCERLGDQEHLFFALRGLWNCVFDRADLEQSVHIADTLLERAKVGRDPEKLALAYRAVGATRFNRGEFAQALEAFLEAIETCGDIGHDNAVKAYGEAPGIVSLAYSGWLLCIQGRMEEGLESGERALELARQCGYPLVTAFVSDLNCAVLLEHRKPADCLALAEEALGLSRDHFLVFWIASLSIKAGWGRAHLGNPVAGVEQLRAGLASWKTNGAALHLPTWTAFLVEALLLAGLTGEASTVLEDAMGIAHRNGELFMLAELHRLRGRLHAQLSRIEEAEADFLRAGAVARQQGARLFELRAASDLAQLWADQGDAEKAFGILAPVVGSFSNTFETPDFLQARNLLARVSRR